MRRSTPVNFSSVNIEGGFWRERLETVATRTIPSLLRQLEVNGVIDALNVSEPPPPLRVPVNEKGFTPQIFWDSDVAKWLEAASYSLVYRRDTVVEAEINSIIGKLAAAQLPDGYLNTWFIAREPDKRWTNLRDNHELYCAGHLIEAAVAHFQATGERSLIDVVVKYVDHIAATFGGGEDQKHGYCGHQEIELALIRLHGVTKNPNHLDLARYFIDERGKQPHYFDMEAVARGDETHEFVGRTYEYNQSHRRVRSQDRAVGHAVRAMYMYAAMTDLACEREDASLKRAVETLWQDVTTRQMYVTGGLGPDHANEGFTEAYDLPNDTAHAETCAAIGLALWAKRMLNLGHDGKYADVMELALYNGALAGLSRDGEHYFYENPLASDGNHRRWAWHRCPCCTGNIARLIASIGGYFYSIGEDELSVHLYGGASATVNLGGRAIGLRETSEYPWSGKIRLVLDPDAPTEFTLRLRIPAHAREATARINGAGIDVAGNLAGGYLEIRRTWNPGDAVDLDLSMRAERIHAYPAAKADIGRVALRRGPLIYCFEAVDNPGAPLSGLRLPPDGKLSVRERSDPLGSIVTLAAEGSVPVDKDWEGELYRSAPPLTEAMTCTAIPYYLWANREAGEMLVWVAED